MSTDNFICIFIQILLKCTDYPVPILIISQTNIPQPTLKYMDFAHLETLLSSLEPKPDKIRTLVDYILLNSSSSEQ